MNELHESISKLRSINNGQILLAGDFNLPDIDWTNNAFIPGGQYPALSKKMLEIVNDFGMEQVVLEPTRGKNTLDLFFTTNPTLVEKVTMTPGMSDHDSIPLVIINCKPKFIKQKPRRIFLYHKANLQALKNELNNWSSLFVQKDTHSCSVNELYDEFQKAFEDAMDSHIPSKTVSKKN